MNDRELLELAARAAGVEYKDGFHPKFGLYTVAGPFWNSLNDDGDALRLGVKLKMGLHYESQFFDDRVTRIVEVYHSHEDGKCQCATESYTDDPFAATRRAITRAAAEIARAADAGGKEGKP